MTDPSAWKPGWSLAVLLHDECCRTRQKIPVSMLTFFSAHYHAEHDGVESELFTDVNTGILPNVLTYEYFFA